MTSSLIEQEIKLTSSDVANSHHKFEQVTTTLSKSQQLWTSPNNFEKVTTSKTLTRLRASQATPTDMIHGTRVSLEVCDNGGGIKATIRSRLTLRISSKSQSRSQSRWFHIDKDDSAAIGTDKSTPHRSCAGVVRNIWRHPLSALISRDSIATSHGMGREGRLFIRISELVFRLNGPWCRRPVMWTPIKWVCTQACDSTHLSLVTTPWCTPTLVHM